MKRINWAFHFLLFCFVFFFTAQSIWAGEARRFHRAKFVKKETPKEFLKIPLEQANPYEIVIPEELGQIKEVHRSPNAGRVIVHIQDAHCNFEAQSNIAKIIEHLIQSYSVYLLAVEGSTGLIDTTPFRNMPNEESKKEVATYYMKKGRLTGPEFLSITGPYHFTIWGIENQDAYLNNYDAFLKTIEFQEEMKKYVKELRLIMDTLKARMFPPDLKEFDRKVTAYNDKLDDYDEYSNLLAKMVKNKKIPVKKYKNFVLQRKAEYLERRIDFSRVDKERIALVDSLGKTLGEEAISDLVVKSVAFRMGKMTSEDFYDYLTEVVKKQNIDLQSYPNLDKYIEYSQSFHSVDNLELLMECEAIEKDIKETMYTDKIQKKLDRLASHLRILTKLFSLELSKYKVSYYLKHKKEFEVKNFISFIKKYAPKHSIPVKISDGVEKVDKSRSVVEDFYKYAGIRDEILVENTLKKMEQDSRKASVMVTGGFHTQGVTKELRDKGYSYIVVAPTITHEDPNNPYIEVMTSQQNAFDNMLTGFETGKVPEN